MKKLDEKELRSKLYAICLHQLNFFCLTKKEENIISSVFDEAADRSFYCFKSLSNKYYGKRNEFLFSPWHSGQWCIFLYYLSNTCGKVSSEAASKIYFLNKMINAVDLYYEIELPSVFFLDHPVGSVMGRANYGNNFSFTQGCTVGNNKGIYPSIGENVRMLSDSKILGACCIGDNVILSANSYVKDIDVPKNTIVFGQSPNLTIKSTS